GYGAYGVSKWGREVAGEPLEPPLGNAVGPVAGERVPAEPRGDVDDAAALLLDQVGHHRARDEPRAAEVRGEDAVPLLGRELDQRGRAVGQAGVVHEHVEPAELVQRAPHEAV